MPVLGLSADLLIGAGCVAEVESSAVSLGEAGLAPRFTEAVEKNILKIKDATCPAIHTALQATEKGVPFMPLRGVLGSDLLNFRKDWQVIDNPLKENDPILIVPAIQPDVALFHARWADEAGNVWIGRRKELATIAHASRRCFVTYEELRPGDMLDDELLAPGVLSSVYVSGVAQATRGAWPLSVAGALRHRRRAPGAFTRRRRRRRKGSSATWTNTYGTVRHRRTPRLLHRAPDRRRAAMSRWARRRRSRRRASFCPSS